MSDNIEKRLKDEKQKIDEQIAPPELEGRLRTALFSQKKQRRLRSPFIWKTIAAILVITMLTSYHYQAFAYYGKKILGFDGIVSDTLQDLNEAGLGQIIDQSFQLKEGITMKLNGLITDENRMILYYTISSANGNLDEPELDYTPSKITGLFTNSMFESGSGKINKANTEIKGTFSFEPPSPFAKKLTLHFHSINKQITFDYDPSKAMEATINQKVNQAVAIDGGEIQFQTITASPTLTTIKGSTDVKEITQVTQPFEQISLIANGELVEPKGNEYSSSFNKTNFELDFDALPKDLQSLQIKVDQYLGYEEVKEKIQLNKGETVEIAGHELTIHDINVSNGQTKVVIATDESVTLDEVSIGDESQKSPLEKVEDQKLTKQQDQIIEERTLIFESTSLPKYLYIEGVHFMKPYNEIINIRLN